MEMVAHDWGGGAWAQATRQDPPPPAPPPAMGKEEAVAEMQAFECYRCTRFPRKALPLLLCLESVLAM